MSVEHIAAVLHHSRATGTAKLVLIGIANHAGDGGSWPTVGTLARYAGVDRSNARKAIQRLEELGEVVRHVQRGGTHTSHEHDRDRPNLYEVLVECPEGCRGDANHGPRPGWRRLKDGTYQPVDNPTQSGRAIAPPLGDSAPPPEGDSAPRTITRTSDETGTASVTGPRASSAPVENAGGVRPLDVRPCLECGVDERTCLRRQIKLYPDQRHAYRPPAWEDWTVEETSESDLAPHPVGAGRDDGRDEHDVDDAGKASSAAPTEEA